MSQPMGYRAVAADVARRIASGEYGPGDRLPSADLLCRIYGIGRTTAMRALDRLRAAGLIDTVFGANPRVRVVVREPKVPDPGTTIIARMPTPDELDTMEIPAGVPLLEFRHGDEMWLLRGDEVTIVIE